MNHWLGAHFFNAIKMCKATTWAQGLFNAPAIPNWNLGDPTTILLKFQQLFPLLPPFVVAMFVESG